MDARSLALTWWETLRERCVRPDGQVVAALGRRRGPLPLWPVTQVLHAAVLVEPLQPEDRLEAHRAVVDALAAGLARYRSGSAWGPKGGARPRYADDVSWVGLALSALARTRREPLPEDVGRAVRFVLACEHPEGGVRWHERTEGRNTCATAPGAHLALEAHLATGDPELLAFAARTLGWLDATLRREDGLYADRIEDGRVVRTVWAYNQGEPVAAHVLLGEATGDPAARVSARDVADATVRRFARPGALWRQPPVFVGIAARDLAVLPSELLGDLLDAYLARAAAEALDDGFPVAGAIAHYDDDPAIDLAGLVQTAAAASALER
ncbi:MAG: glycoside hydrolase family 76 protein [Planctomycetaceae bacterium]